MKTRDGYVVSFQRHEVPSLEEEGYLDLREFFIVSDHSWLNIDGIGCRSKWLKRRERYVVSFWRYEVKSLEEAVHPDLSEFFIVSDDSRLDVDAIRCSFKAEETRAIRGLVRGI
jgi:hypothetical protein